MPVRLPGNSHHAFGLATKTPAFGFEPLFQNAVPATLLESGDLSMLIKQLPSHCPRKVRSYQCFPFSYDQFWCERFFLSGAPKQQKTPWIQFECRPVYSLVGQVNGLSQRMLLEYDHPKKAHKEIARIMPCFLLRNDICAFTQKNMKDFRWRHLRRNDEDMSGHP